MSSKGYHWYNNGIVQVNALNCPEGFTSGMLASSALKAATTYKEKRKAGLIKIPTTEETQARIIKEKETKHKAFEDLLNRINKDELYQLYIIENKPYTELLSYYNIKGWTLDKVLKAYDIHKSKQQASSLVLQTKYEQAGGKDNYDALIKDKINNTKINKYGSVESYNNHISDLYAITWNSKSEEELKAHATLSLSHGGGWNHETSQQTLKEKYGVTNAYALATYTNDSKVNEAFAQRLETEGLSYNKEFKLTSANGDWYRYDFQVGPYKTLIEIDPWPFHNSTWTPIKGEQPKDPKYHYNKSKLARDNDYRCIHIFDWDNIDKIISLLKDRPLTFARKCEVKEVIDKKEAEDFINQYHLQGYVKDKVRLGLYLENKLISIMTFGTPRYNKNYQWELIRYCSSYNVIGGAERLFKHFVDTYHPTGIISYCDLSKFSGDTYTKLGFKLKRISSGGKHWYNIYTKQHITDNLLRQRGYDQLFQTHYGNGTSNEELMRADGFVEIYDAGQATYVY
jgi:hypothetical protein